MATQQTRNGLEYIIQAITNIVEPKVDTLKYDKTYRAKVTTKVDEGVYKVQIAGIEYQLSYGGTLNVGDIVKVKAPLNNFSDIYIEALPGSGGGGGGTTNYNDLTNKPILNTNITTAQTPNASEIIRETISLHKVSKTGNYSDLNNLPSLNFIPTSQKGAANGVAELDSNVKVPKAQLPSDTVYDSNYVHTDKNFTDALNTKLNGIEAGAQVNIIDTIQRNGTVLPISNKTVNVTVPTKTSDLTNDGDGNSPFTTQSSVNTLLSGKADLDSNSKVVISQLPIATDSSLGVIKAGSNLTITADGTLSSTVINNLGSFSGEYALSANQGRVLNESILDLESTKLTADNLIAGENITITKSGNDCTISSTGGGGATEVNISETQPTETSVELWVDLSEDTPPSGSIGVIDNLNSTSTVDALSANQGKILNGIMTDYVGTQNSDSGYCELPNGLKLCWGKENTNSFESYSGNGAYRKLVTLPITYESFYFPIVCNQYAYGLDVVNILSTPSLNQLYLGSRVKVGSFYANWLTIGK